MFSKKVLITLFFAVLILIPMATFLLPKKSFSAEENRELAETPHPTMQNISDKSFMENAEAFLADHIVGRNQFVEARTRLELASGKREVNGVFVGSDRLLQNIAQPDERITASNLAAINAFAEKYKDVLSTNVMLVPTAVEFYPDERPALANTVDQYQYVQDFYAGLENAAGVDVYTTLSANAASDIFYRTDHHWTSYGAYLGYSALAKNLGFRAAAWDSFNVEHASHDFLGTLYSKVLVGEDLKDSVDLYTYASGDPVQDVIKYNGSNTITYSSIFFREKLKEKDQYQVFLGGNNGVVRVTTNVKNGKKLLLFKDSFANSVMQFLPIHYEEITLIDLRYMRLPLSEFVDIEDYDQALFLYNVGTFTETSDLNKVMQY